MPVTVRREPLQGALAQQLIEALNAELSGRYPEEGTEHFRLDPEEVAPGQGVFLVAFADDARAIGCGALRRLGVGGSDGELKRMYVRPEARGRRVAVALLGALEEEARTLGLSRLVLETGIRQPEAIALYTRHGFVRIEAYGEYVGSPFSVCMAKSLGAGVGE
jgi:GNAT superfamily N-acetyltransferase